MDSKTLMEGKALQPGQRSRAWKMLVTLVALVTTVCAGLVGAAPAHAQSPEPSAISGVVTGTVQDGTGKVIGAGRCGQEGRHREPTGAPSDEATGST